MEEIRAVVNCVSNVITLANHKLQKQFSESKPANKLINTDIESSANQIAISALVYHSMEDYTA